MSSWKASMEYGLQKIVNDGVTVAKEVVAAGANPVLTTRGIEKTTKALVAELKLISKEVDDSELADVAVVSAGNNHKVGNMIAEAMSKVGRKGVVKLYDREVMGNSLIQIVRQRERLYHLQGTNQVLKAHLRSQFSPQPYTLTAAVAGRCNCPAAMDQNNVMLDCFCNSV